MGIRRQVSSALRRISGHQNVASTATSPAPLDAEAQHQRNLEAEARVFAGKTNDKVRSLAWSSIRYFGARIREKLDIGAEAERLLAGRTDLKALTLACGDMKGEYPLLKRLGATSIVAYDISEGQRQRCLDKVFDGSVALDYRIEDVNQVQLEPETYDLVYMQQSLHHIVEIEQLLERINISLKPDGIFLLNDYVGEPFLQRGPKQREICQEIWTRLPERLRIDKDGAFRPNLFIPDKAMLSPFEAIRSDAIRPALKESFDTHAEFLFGGIIFPITNNFAPNYLPDNETDETLIRMLWYLDELLVGNGTVEPTFVRGVYRKKTAPTAQSTPHHAPASGPR